MRLTRDLGQLDALIAEAEAVDAEARATVPAEPPPAWARLLDAADRRLALYRQTRGAIAQAQSVAGLRDREASLLTSRARLVLHRYVRHFAGQDRRTRDLGRMQEIITDLEIIAEQLRPMIERVQVPSVAEEIQAIGEFLGFFHAERAEIDQAWRSGSRLDQSASLGAVAEDLYAAWALAMAEDRALRRPELLDRLVASLDRVLEALMTLRHANMPDEHESRIARAARELVRWQEEAGRTREARSALAPRELELRLLGRARALHQRFREGLSGEPGSRDRKDLADLCDQMEELERQLTALHERSQDPELAAELAWLRDVLVAVERVFDQVVAAQVQEP